MLTVVDLFSHVLRPIAGQRGLETWEAIAADAGEEWYPSRIAFGKHKGRSVWEARENRELREWLEWLARSSNARSARMGHWYLQQLERAEPEAAGVATWRTGEASGEPDAFPPQGVAVVVDEHPELPKLRVLVDAARARLAELEVAYTIDKARVDSLQAGLFQRLRTWCQERDRLRLVVNYRQQFLEVLLRQGEEEAEQVERQYRQAKTRSEQEYEETAQTLAARRELTADEQGELRKLWKKLVSLYHPDRFAHEPDKLATCEKLTAAINGAKDRGDIGTLRQIAGDPYGFIVLSS